VEKSLLERWLAFVERERTIAPMALSVKMAITYTPFTYGELVILMTTNSMFVTRIEKLDTENVSVVLI